MKFEIFKPQAVYEQGSATMQGSKIFPAMGEATLHDRLFVICDGAGEPAKCKIISSTICNAMYSLLSLMS